MELTNDEKLVLQWLGESDECQYGECYGATLDSLIEKGLAVVMGPDSGLHNSFIAKGTGIMYRAVRLTDDGRKVLGHE